MFTIKYERRQRKRSAQVSIDIPQEILFEILSRLPVKSLLRFRFVCKSWKTLISSPSFINAHLERNVMKTASDCLLIQTNNRKCLTLFYAEAFAKSLHLEYPRDKNDCEFSVYGSCNGLICISHRGLWAFKSPIYLWNPSIRKFKILPRGFIRGKCTTFCALGLAHCRGNDYKVVRIARFNNRRSTFKAEVYSLNLDSWRKISAVPPVSHHARMLQGECACLNGVVYWIIDEYQYSPCRITILSFNMDSEIFQKVMLPDILQGPQYAISIRALEKSLFLLNVRSDGNNKRCDICVLKMGTWKMISTILFPSYGWAAWPFGLTTNGAIHIAILPSQYGGYVDLVLHDPKSQQVKDIGIIRLRPGFNGSSYVEAWRESLVLLNS